MPTAPVTYWTKPITTIILRPCLDERAAEWYYLRWLSARGQWEGWLFSDEHDEKTTLDSATDYTPGYERDVVPLARPGVDSVTLHAGGLTAQQYRGLTTLLDSPAVYRQFPDGSREWVTVAKNANASRSTGDGRFEFAVELDLARRNSLTN